MVAAGSGHKVWSLWQLGCSQQNKVCPRLEAKKTLERPKNSLYVWLIFKRELTCVV